MNITNHQIRTFAHWFIPGVLLLLCSIFSLVLICFDIITTSTFFKLFFTILGISFSIGLAVKKIVHHNIPLEHICKTREEINKFMVNFIGRSTGTVTIVSHSLSWLCEKEAHVVVEKIKSMATNGTKFEIITTEDIDAKIQSAFHNCPSITTLKRSIKPRSRFTVINSTRDNAAELAIANGSIPCHKISVYNASESQHIVNLALDTIEQIRDSNGK